jgi:CBS domain-containing protein
MIIGEIIELIGDREIPRVRAESDMDEVIDVMVRSCHTRVVYVLDDKDRLLGYIEIGNLLRHLFPHLYEGKIHSHGLLRRITVENAEHLMAKVKVTAGPDETVDEVLQRMAHTGRKEIPVLDEEGRIIADINAVDLLRFYHSERDRAETTRNPDRT